MDGVPTLGLRVQPADGTLGRLRRVCLADRLAEHRHRPVRLQDQWDHGPRGHELDELVVERALLVHGVERPGLRPVERDQLEGAHREAGVLQMGQDLSRLARADCIRLDDRKREAHESPVGSSSSRGPR